jgi:hypothetical protein
LLLSETVLVLEGTYLDVVHIRSRIPAFQLPKKAIELNRFRRFEYEAEYEYREAEYEKAELLPTKIPEELVKAVTIAFAGFALSDIH